MASPTTTVPPIRMATSADRERVLATLTLAFSADPAVRWLYPEPHQYWTYGPQFLQAFGGNAFEQSTAWYTEGYAGAALWLPPDIHPEEEPLLSLFEQSVAEDRRDSLFGVLELMSTYHPAEPHWYLAILGVDPPGQGRGYGSALLQHTLAKCDEAQQLAYLESSNPRNNPLYERHGFEILGTIQVGSSPPIWPMLRRPRRGERTGDGAKQRYGIPSPRPK